MDKKQLEKLELTKEEVMLLERQKCIFLAVRDCDRDKESDIQATKYALNQLNKKDITYQEAMKVIRNELKKDHSGGSIYYGWQSNLAMLIMDNTQLNAEECNIIAIKFLNRLTED